MCGKQLAHKRLIRYWENADPGAVRSGAEGEAGIEVFRASGKKEISLHERGAVGGHAAPAPWTSFGVLVCHRSA